MSKRLKHDIIFKLSSSSNETVCSTSFPSCCSVTNSHRTNLGLLLDGSSSIDPSFVVEFIKMLS